MLFRTLPHQNRKRMINQYILNIDVLAARKGSCSKVNTLFKCLVQFWPHLFFFFFFFDLLTAVTVELPKARRLESTVSVTLGDRREKITSKRGRYRVINWEPERAWYSKYDSLKTIPSLTIYVGKLRPTPSLKCHGRVDVISKAHAKRKLTGTHSFLNKITTPVSCVI